MKEKYFASIGEISFRLWMFSLAFSELQNKTNREKLNNLTNKVSAFAQSEIVAEQATEAQKADLKLLLSKLNDLL